MPSAFFWRLRLIIFYLRRFQDVLGEEEVYFPDALKNIDFGDANVLRPTLGATSKIKGSTLGPGATSFETISQLFAFPQNSLQPRSFDGMRPYYQT